MRTIIWLRRYLIAHKVLLKLGYTKEEAKNIIKPQIKKENK